MDLHTSIVLHCFFLFYYYSARAYVADATNAATPASTRTNGPVGAVGASCNDGQQETSKAQSQFLSSDCLQMSAESKVASTTAEDPMSCAAQPASIPTSAVDTPAQTPVVQMAQPPKGTNFVPMRPVLPCDDAQLWEVLKIIMAKPFPDVESLRSVMIQWSGYKVHLYGVRAMLHYYPETVGTFFSTTLPFIVKCALQLKTLVAAAEVRS